MFDLLRLRRAACGLALLLGALAPPPVHAQGRLSLGERCATPQPTEAEQQMFAATVQQWLQQHPNPEGADVTIPIAFHVIHSGSQGNIPDQWITDQVAVLNAAFVPMGYQFIAASVDRTDNAAWFTNTSGNEAAITQALAIDTAHFLNIYTASLGGGLLGWAYLPGSWPQGHYRDAVFLHYNTLPGGTFFPYHLGDTGTHEVGHWAGLHHTFQSGCAGGDDPPGCQTGGDQVCDTAAESTPAFGCPVGRNTCPTGGPDPIENFMDYTDDACMNHFTPGQAERSLALMNSLRPLIMNASGAFAAPEEVEFGGVVLGESATEIVRVVNLTDAPLVVTSISTDNPLFTTNVSTLTVPAGSVGEVEVTFTPDTTTPQTSTLSFVTTNPDVGTLTVALSGNGIPLAPVLSVNRTGFLVSAPVGGTASATLIISNDGAATLNYDFGSIPPWVSSITPTPGTIAPGAQQTVTITLSAAGLSTGVQQDLLHLNTNDPEQEELRIHLVFAVGGAFPPPPILEPVYGEANVPTEAVLRWQAVASAFSYDVQVSPDEGFTVITFSGNSPFPSVTFTADAGATLFWRVRSVNAAGTPSDWTLPFTFTVTDIVANEPDGAVAGPAALGTAYPNPTRGEVTVPFTLREASAVMLHVFDVTGRRVGSLANGEVFAAGEHALAWSADRLPAGVYLVRFIAGNAAETGRLVLVR